MKTLVAIILALGLGFAAAYVVVSKQKDAELQKLKAQPQAAAVAAPAPAPVEKVVMMSAPAAPAEETAQDVLNDLLNVKLGSGNERNSGLRMVVFKLETLTLRGKLAVPAIREFIGRNVDVDYSQQDNSNSATNQADATVASAGTAGGGNNRRNNNRGNNQGGFAGGGGGPGGGFGGNRGGARRARNLQTLQADWVV